MYERDGKVIQSYEEYLHALPELQAEQRIQEQKKRKKRIILLVLLIVYVGIPALITLGFMLYIFLWLAPEPRMP